MALIPAGPTVEFPNADPIFHNAFSLSAARQFDLGFYPKGQSRSVRFDRAGVVRISVASRRDRAAQLSSQWTRIGRGVGARPSDAIGELQQFRFDAPNFVVPPRILGGYAEPKALITPRIFAALREGFLKTESVLDTLGVSAPEFAPTLQSAEFGMGYWLHARVLAKVSYEFMRAAGASGTTGGDIQSVAVGMEVAFSATPPTLHAAVSRIGAPLVMTTVCSKCAARLPSAVRMVHLSGCSSPCPLLTAMMGSMVITRPSCRRSRERGS